MTSIIVFANGLSEAEIRNSMGLSASATDIHVIGAGQGNSGEAQNESLTDALQAAVAQSSGERIALVDARASVDLAALKAAASSKATSALELFYNEQSDQITSLGAENLVQSLDSSAQLPLAAAVVSRSFIGGLGLIPVDSSNALIMAIAVAAIAEGEKVQISNQLAVETSSSTALTSSDKSALLRMMVNSINIEDLFPNRAWNEHQAENASLCYQTIATMFIRYGDLQSAGDAVSLSEQLEESPRALALKGIIAMLKGESLEAVANMVSSLQEYERVKADPENARLKIGGSPRDIEVINTKLQSGLNELNLRNNEKAAEHFANALFLFDTFYEDCGLDQDAALRRIN